MGVAMTALPETGAALALRTGLPATARMEMKHPNRITGLAPSECSQALLAQPRTFMADVIGPIEQNHGSRPI